MGFIDEKELPRYQKNTVEFFDFTPGEHKIRVLDGKAHAENTHWIKNYRVKCLGEKCPICAKYPEEYPRKAYFVNVLDFTYVKECPSCGKTYKAVLGKFPKICVDCNTIIADVKEKPNNKVTVLSGGKRLFVDQLNVIFEEYGDLRNYDLELLITGVGRERQIVVRPSKEESQKINTESLEKYDLSKITIELTPVEMIRLKEENIMLADIYSARNKSEAVDNDGVKNTIKSLFSE